MKNILFFLLFVPLIFFGQKEVVKNGVNIVTPAGYSYNSGLSTLDKARFLNDANEELSVFVFKPKSKITVPAINSVILSSAIENINWKLMENNPTDDIWATISYGIAGIYGYRVCFELNGKLILIQSYARSYNEALKTVFKASFDIKD